MQIRKIITIIFHGAARVLVALVHVDKFLSEVLSRQLIGSGEATDKLLDIRNILTGKR